MKLFKQNASIPCQTKCGVIDKPLKLKTAKKRLETRKEKWERHKDAFRNIVLFSMRGFMVCKAHECPHHKYDKEYLADGIVDRLTTDPHTLGVMESVADDLKNDFSTSINGIQEVRGPIPASLTLDKKGLTRKG
ncbi:MAG: hypothetical protein HOF21_08405 [Nitrospina sp.]|nr:hypothetical protein [Nitrospina sp.]